MTKNQNEMRLDALANEVDANYIVFQDMSFDDLDKGKWALMKNQKVVEILVDKEDAEKMGMKLYPEGIFSLQLIGAVDADLGYVGYALHTN